MRRYKSLLVFAFVLMLTVTGFTYLSGHADRTTAVPVHELRVLTTLPAEPAAILAAEYEHVSRVRINFVPLSAKELTQRLTGAKKDKAELVLADSAVLRQAAANGAFVPFTSEQTDAVADEFKAEDDAWAGVWYDPVVFCYNNDYLRLLPRIPKSWHDLPGPGGMRIGLTDFLAADASANLFFSLVTNLGEKQTMRLLTAVQPHVVQYAKYLSTPVRMTGMGEADFSLVVQSEALRYINDGYPLRLVYPVDGTAYQLTGVALCSDEGPETAVAQHFAEWLLSDEAQLALQKNNFYFISTNPMTLAYKSFAGKNLVLFDKQPDFAEAERHRLLDTWVKEVRLR